MAIGYLAKRAAKALLKKGIKGGEPYGKTKIYKKGGGAVKGTAAIAGSAGAGGYAAGKAAKKRSASTKKKSGAAKLVESKRQKPKKGKGLMGGLKKAAKTAKDAKRRK